MENINRCWLAAVCLGVALFFPIMPAAAGEGGGDGGSDGGNWVTVTVTVVETVQVGEKVIDVELIEVPYWVPAQEVVVRQGYQVIRQRNVPYTAYRIQVRWVEKVVSVVREVSEKVTTWVEKTVWEPVTTWVQKKISRPVTSWIKRTKTWFERTWLGKLIKRVTTRYEKVVTWVRQTIWEKVTTWVKRTVVEPVVSWVKKTIVEPLVQRVQETFTEPYTAYRLEEYVEWVPPETEIIPGHYETCQERKEVTVPVMQEVSKPHNERIDAGSLPTWAAQDFFGRIDHHLRADQQQELFGLWRDALGLFAAADSQKSYQEALNIFFGGYTADAQTVTAALAEDYGLGREPWSDYNPDPEVAQNLNLFEILGYGYPSTVHKNLCGELAVMAAMGLSLEEGLDLFAEVETSRMIVETNEDGQQKITWPRIFGKDLLTDVIETGGGSATHSWQLKDFFEQASGGGLEAEHLSYPAGDPPGASDVARMLVEGKSMVALVNIDTMDRGRLQTEELSGDSAPHWVTVTGIIPTQNGQTVVRVYNPYQNSEELYSWESFSGSWENTEGNEGHCQLVVAKPAK